MRACMRMADGWMLMGHMRLTGIYDTQNGPRGDEKSFLAGMLMGAARRDFADGDTLNLRAMLSPDPFMGKSGYPLLLASRRNRERHDAARSTASIRTICSWSFRQPMRTGFPQDDSVFVYGGLPGEPAFGPPAFMHRASGMDNPEAPISHHWLDSTHITFGVVTAGWVHDDWKLEMSQFTGREPDQNRFDIDSPREWIPRPRGVSFNPDPHWSLQASWAHLNSPEQLNPPETKTAGRPAPAMRADLDGLGDWFTTLAYGRKKRSDGVSSTPGFWKAN